MFEGLVEFLLEILLEAVFQFAVEILVELGSAFFDLLKKSRLARMPFAALTLAIGGGMAGFVTTLIFPRVLFPLNRYSGISLFLAPLATGVAMHFYGSWLHEKGRETTLLATFWGGGLFAFCLALVRWLMVGG
jgi:hypothetical protein